MMGITRTITWGDVERYQCLRETSRKLNARLTKTIPRVAYDEIGAALGILRKGRLAFETESVAAVLTDCCLYDWILDGRNVITNYSLDQPAPAGTDEEYLLAAYQQAQFRILVAGSVAAGAGIECRDALSGERLFLMDISYSSTASPEGSIMAARTIPLDGYWMTTGAGLPITDKKAGREVVAEVERLLKADPPCDPHVLSLAILRKCLECGADQHMTYVGTEGGDHSGDPQGADAARAYRPSRRMPSRNQPCPCGSGKKYKRCCLPKS